MQINWKISCKNLPFCFCREWVFWGFEVLSRQMAYLLGPVFLHTSPACPCRRLPSPGSLRMKALTLWYRQVREPALSARP